MPSVPVRSAALLVYRVVGRAAGAPADGGSAAAPSDLEVLLGHMGGPFWERKDDGGWSIPKGLHDPDESPLDAARREFAEELGVPPPDGEPLALGEFKQPSGKVITAFALAGEVDLSAFASNTFELEWPKGSGRIVEFPEIDRAEWFDLPTARRKLVKGQVPILYALESALGT